MIIGSPTASDQNNRRWTFGIPTFDGALGGLTPGLLVCVVSHAFDIALNIALHNSYDEGACAPTLILHHIRQVDIRDTLLDIAGLLEPDEIQDFSSWKRELEPEEAERLRRVEQQFTAALITFRRPAKQFTGRERQIEKWARVTGGGPVIIVDKEPFDSFCRLKTLAVRLGIPILASCEPRGLMVPLPPCDIAILVGWRQDQTPYSWRRANLLGVIDTRRGTRFGIEAGSISGRLKEADPWNCNYVLDEVKVELPETKRCADSSISVGVTGVRDRMEKQA
jgi:hypothetical protein